MNILNVGHYFSFIVGFATLLIGILAVVKPEQMSKNFGIAVSGPALPYVVSTGIRDVFMGLVVLILSYLQVWQGLGMSHLCIGIVAISDFLVVRKFGDKKTSFIHLFGAVVVIAYGAWLLMGTQQ